MQDVDIVHISKRIHEFQKRRISELGSELTPDLVFLHLCEEVGEIARQLVNRKVPMREYQEDNLREEIAQAMLDLLVLSKLFRMNLLRELDAKIEAIEKRARLKSSASA